MMIPGRTYSKSFYSHRFDFQGLYSEKDAETNWNIFQLRAYDSRIGRWMSPDPYAQFPSPYEGMGNNPINGIDPDGGYFFGLFGSTSKQRKAARTFQKENGGQIENYHKRDIHVKRIEAINPDFFPGTEPKAENGEMEMVVVGAKRITTYFDRTTGAAIEEHKGGYIRPYSPDGWQEWRESSTLAGRFSYNVANSFWLTAQNLGLKHLNKDLRATHIGGGYSNENENVQAFVGAAPSFVPIGKIPAAVNYLRFGGPTFSQAKNAIWSQVAKPTFQILRNPSTNQVFKVYAEIHHRFIPQRWGMPNWITNNRFNLQIINSIEHAVKDPYRYQFLPKWVKEVVDNGSLQGIYY